MQARFAFKISLSHIAGEHNIVADALSRAHISRAYHGLAQEFISSMRLVVVRPCTHILSHLHPPILSRSGVELAGGSGGDDAGTGPSTWDSGCPVIYSGRTDGVLLQVQHGPPEHDGDRRMPVGGIPGEQEHLPCNNQEQSVPRKRLYEVDRGLHGRIRACQGVQGIGRSSALKRLCSEEEKGGHTGPDPTRGPQWAHGAHSRSPYVLRGTSPIRGRPTDDKEIRPHAALDQGRCSAGGKCCNYKSRKEPSVLRPAQGRYIIPHRRSPHMPTAGGTRSDPAHPRLTTRGATTDLHQHSRPGTHHIYKSRVGTDITPYTPIPRACALKMGGK